MKHSFGLLGETLGYSFSRKYFTEKFEKEHLSNFTYDNYEMPNLDDFCVIWDHIPSLVGLNVTIPYKTAVIPFLDAISKEAKKINAVNTIVRIEGKLIGYNTDVIGFNKSLTKFIGGEKPPKHALILGTGGAAQAVKFVLSDLGIQFLEVSRSPNENQVSYQRITGETMASHHLIINTTPLGTHPNTSECPDIPYQFITEKHLLFDLIYNPEKTLFLRRGEEAGAKIKNGYQMLEEQAEASWRIWNSYLNEK